jgi:hypothetical protein
MVYEIRPLPLLQVVVHLEKSGLLHSFFWQLPVKQVLCVEHVPHLPPSFSPPYSQVEKVLELVLMWALKLQQVLHSLTIHHIDFQIVYPQLLSVAVLVFQHPLYIA